MNECLLFVLLSSHSFSHKIGILSSLPQILGSVCPSHNFCRGADVHLCIFTCGLTWLAVGVPMSGPGRHSHRWLWWLSVLAAQAVVVTEQRGA